VNVGLELSFIMAPRWDVQSHPPVSISPILMPIRFEHYKHIEKDRRCKGQDVDVYLTAKV
jgi:hypothetical protein